MAPGDRLRALIAAPSLLLASPNIIEAPWLAAGTIISLDASDFAGGEGDEPRFALSENAALHMESATPLALGSGTQGSGVLAVPMRSTFQENLVAIRLIQRVGWGMRRAGRVAYVENVTW
jgi:hypothetical protein